MNERTLYAPQPNAPRVNGAQKEEKDNGVGSEHEAAAREMATSA